MVDYLSDIIKISISGVLVFLTAYYTLQNLLKNEEKKRYYEMPERNHQNAESGQAGCLRAFCALPGTNQSRFNDSPRAIAGNDGHRPAFGSFSQHSRRI